MSGIAREETSSASYLRESPGDEEVELVDGRTAQDMLAGEASKFHDVTTCHPMNLSSFVRNIDEGLLFYLLCIELILSMNKALYAAQEITAVAEN